MFLGECVGVDVPEGEHAGSPVREFYGEYVESFLWDIGNENRVER